MRLKPQHIVWIVVGVILVPMAVYLITSDLPGKREQSGDVVSKTLGTAEPKATASFDITLREGGDPGHEADHIFESVKNPAIASAAFNLKTLELKVRYDDALITEPDIGQLLATAGYIQATAGDATPATLSADGTSQEVSITPAQKALEPKLVRAKAGVPLKMVFGQGAAHLASISIAELGIKQDLSQGGATVEVADPKPGTYNIVCSEGYPDGTLIVE